MSSRIGFGAWRFWACSALVAALAACGGSGSGGPPTEAVSVSPQSVVLGQSATLTWLASDANACNGQGAWSGPQAVQGTMTVPALPAVPGAPCRG